MARCYSAAMQVRHPFSKNPALPRLWLVSDARNDAVIERALARLPRGSGLILRHYHLSDEERAQRIARLTRRAHSRGHAVIMAGTMAAARRLGADGAYGPAKALARGGAGLRLVTAHSLREIGQASRADAVLLSPAFPTRSHPGKAALGAIRFKLLAARSPVPVIALGGMSAKRAGHLNILHWAGIDAFLR